LCDSVWDVLAGTVPAKDDILIYDGTGRQSAVSCALKLAREGKTVRIATPDETLAVEMPYPDKAGFRKELALLGVECTPYVRLRRLVGEKGRLVAKFRHELTDAGMELGAGQVIVEHGTTPAADLFHDLRAASSNDGITDIDFILGRAPAKVMAESRRTGFQLHRIGDAVSSRDIYSSIQDAFRLCSRI
jgi:hypothetical protein